MNEPRPADLEARMSRLEAAVDQLQQAVRRIEAAAAPAAAPPVSAVEPAPLAAAEPVPAPASGDDAGGPLAWLPGVQPVLNGEFWLSKVGIGLLLLGVAFLFKYSIEQGWITPVVRLAAGAAVGTALTAWGLRIHGSQRNLSRVLLGGGIAAFYMVGFAASQLYGLLPHSAALVYMAAVTSAAFLLSLREDEPVLTIVGTLGGVGTPFLLYPRTGSLGWLSAYVAFIALWNGVVYARRRWDTALLTAGIGSWVALVSGLVVSERAGPPPLDARWALQGALVLVWAVLGVLPAALHLLRADPGGEADDDEADDREILAPAGLAFVSPLVAAVFTSAVWDLTARQWGAGTAVLGLAYLAAALWARERRGEMAAVLGLAGAVLLTTGTGIGAEGEARIVLLAAEAAGLHLLSRRGLGRGAAGWAHLVFGVLGIAFLARLGGFNPLAAVFAPDGGTAGAALPATRRLADLAVAGALLAASLGARDRTGRILRAAALAALFLWGWRELAVLPN
ncbi:MAG: DUF2339 domain-containing protein, partial [Gemmatimonadota bacterium]